MFNNNPDICEKCALFYRECQCAKEAQVQIQHRVTLVTTHLERKIRSNTGRLLELRLKNFRAIYLGQRGWENEIEEEKNRQDYFPILLFPNPGSPTPHQIAESANKPLNIFLFDTSWRAARKWLSKTIFHSLKRIELKGKYTSRYFLRTNPNDNYLCTFQSLTCILTEIDPQLEPITNDLTKTLDYVVKGMAKERNRKYIIDGEVF